MVLQKNETGSTAKSLDFEKKMIIHKISQMSNLPTPGAGIMKVMLLLRDEEVAMKELIDAISRNQSLVARILKLINSGYYGLRKNIDTVDRAVNLLGILKVKQVVYSASIMDIFTKDEEQEWNHAYSSSVLISNIMEEHDIPAASNLPLTVLMHDIGKVILRRFAPKKYAMALDLSTKEHKPVCEAEEALLHINHAMAGGWLLEKWQMTNDIYMPVANHHSMEVPQEFVLETALLQFVNWVDCTARNIACIQPTKELMTEAGFEDIDNNYWIEYQRNMIDELETKPETEGKDKEVSALARMAAHAEKGEKKTGVISDVQAVPGSKDINNAPYNKPPPPISLPKDSSATGEVKTATEKIKKAQPALSPQFAAAAAKASAGKTRKSKSPIDIIINFFKSLFNKK